MKYSPLRKLFGSGPDTFGIVTQSYYRETIEHYYEIFDSAYDECLQYLITIGIVGLFSYLFLLVSSIIGVVEASKRGDSAISVVYVVSYYAVQTVANIGVSIVSPVMFTLLSVGMSVQNCADKTPEVKMMRGTKRGNKNNKYLYKDKMQFTRDYTGEVSDGRGSTPS